jgi:hypothetical protein
VFVRKGNQHYKKHSSSSGDTLESYSLGIYTTKAGIRYHLQFDPDGKLAQAVLLPHGLADGHPVLTFTAESRQEAAKILIQELDSGSYY